MLRTPVPLNDPAAAFAQLEELFEADELAAGDIQGAMRSMVSVEALSAFTATLKRLPHLLAVLAQENVM